MSRSPRRPHPPVGFTRRPRIADQMTPQFMRLVESSFLAERAGDAAAALEYHVAVPMFRRSAHREQLTQLAGLATEMPPWLWARWAAYQCTRAEDKDRSGEIVRAALRYVVEMFYVEKMQQAHDEGADPIQVLATVSGESWLFHQVCTYELGGLRRFLDELATAELADNCGLVRRWCGARMGGYQLASTTPEALTVIDLRSGRTRELLDLGAGVHAREGGGLIGRIVPSGTSPEWMFDSRPVAVDEATARDVATSLTEGGWISTLRAALDAGRIDLARFDSEDRDLATDIPSWTLVEAGTPPDAMRHVRSQLASGSDGVGRAAFRILRHAVEGGLPDAMAAYVAAAVVNAHGHAEAWRLLASATPSQRWAHWAELVPEPARSRLRRLASNVDAA